MTSFFSKTQRDLQDRFEGTKVADALLERRVHTEFSAKERAFVESRIFFFIASAAQGQIDCSYRGGEPGFVKVSGSAQLTWGEYDGNRMFRTLGNIAHDPRVALIFVNFDRPSEISGPGEIGRLRVNGKARIVENPDPTQHCGAKLLVVLNADYIFPNCPRYLPDMRLEKGSKYNPREDYCPPEPEWKSRDYIKPLL